MVENAGTFVRRINQRARNVEKGVAKVKMDVITEMFSEVVFSTPVDKGVARSNWQVGLNHAPSGVLPAYSPGRHLGLGESANASGALSAGLPIIESSRPEDRVYIVNNAPYIQRLNNGWSAQAGANFIERAMDRARKRVQRGRLLE